MILVKSPLMIAKLRLVFTITIAFLSFSGVAQSTYWKNTELNGIDAVYEEAMVTFGPDPNAGCPVSRDILARMDQPLRPASA